MGIRKQMRIEKQEKGEWFCHSHEINKCGGAYELHHIRALELGGNNDYDNLEVYCQYHHGLIHSIGRSYL